MRTVLLDADIWIYRACLNHEFEVQWDEDIWSLWGDFGAAQGEFDANVLRIQKHLEADRVIMALSDPMNFRKEVLPTYKENRKGKRKPVTYRPLREYVHEKYECFQRDGLEGDDILGILSTSKKIVPGEKIVVSVDKDMNSLPGLHVNDTHAMEAMLGPEQQAYADSIREVSESEADRFHLLQTLAGDATDGYSGCPGIGMVKAAALLDAGRVLAPVKHVLKSGPRKGEEETRWEAGVEGTPWQVIVSAYQSAGLSEEMALATARVARICRVTDYDFKKKEPILWTPNQK